MSSRRFKRVLLASVVLAAASAVAASAVFARGRAPARGPVLPEIRTSTEGVPACVTPGRLMSHLQERTKNLDARFRDIARYYKLHGEALGIRWDYAFYQMLVETNYLSYKTGSGRWGDVMPRQNNFAGIGATGGVPGDSFGDVSAGVLAQMQHLVAYSGERVPNPIAPRTREMQDGIITISLALRRPVRFSDLTNRWAKSRTYGTVIEMVAERYRRANCTAAGEPLRPSSEDVEVATERAPPHRSEPIPRPAGSEPSEHAQAPRTPACDVLAASYGGSVALLIRSMAGATVNYTVLQVDEAFEQPQADAFIKTHMPNGRAIARFASREHALARAFELCPAPS